MKTNAKYIHTQPLFSPRLYRFNIGSAPLQYQYSIHFRTVYVGVRCSTSYSFMYILHIYNTVHYICIYTLPHLRLAQMTLKYYLFKDHACCIRHSTAFIYCNSLYIVCVLLYALEIVMSPPQYIYTYIICVYATHMYILVYIYAIYSIHEALNQTNILNWPLKSDTRCTILYMFVYINLYTVYV